MCSGGIVDDVEIGFALENQTRPVYSPLFWTVPGLGDIVVAHELAHQWYGDSLALAAWKHIWLNEGFATYAEWLWTEHEGQATVQESFDDPEILYAASLVYAVAGERESALVTAQRALEKGMQPRWFSIPAFAGLRRTDPEFARRVATIQPPAGS